MASDSSSPPRGNRRLDRLLGVDWDEPPSTLLDVEVFVVYRDGTRELVDDEYLELAPRGVVVEDYPLAAGKRVRRVIVDYNESITPLAKLGSFLRNLPEGIRKTRAEFADWYRERKRR